MLCFIDTQAQMVAGHTHRNRITKRRNLLHQYFFTRYTTHFHQLQKYFIIPELGDHGFLAWL